MYHEVLRDRVAYVKSSEEYIMNISAVAQRIYDRGKREWDKEIEELRCYIKGNKLTPKNS